MRGKNRCSLAMGYYFSLDSNVYLIFSIQGQSHQLWRTGRNDPRSSALETNVYVSLTKDDELL